MWGQVSRARARTGAEQRREKEKEGERGEREKKERKRKKMENDKGKKKENKERGERGERFVPEISAATTAPFGHARLSGPRAAALAGGGVVVRDARHKKKRGRDSDW